jgi:hypothetical protein
MATANGKSGTDPAVLIGPAVGEAVRAMFTTATAAQRRVILVGFVGDNPHDLLQDVKGVEIVCWPKWNATSARGVKALQDAGATVRFSDRLHAKVYWVSGAEAVIGSPNLSGNGLAGGLVEACVVVRASTVDIDALVGSLKARDVTEGELRSLARENARHRRSGGTFDDDAAVPQTSFVSWFDGADRPRFKLGWYEGTIKAPPTLETVAASAAPDGEVTDFLSCRRAATYCAGDWILVLHTKKGGRSPRESGNVNWLLVRDVVKVPKEEAAADDARFRHYAYQLDSASAVPPFKLNKATKAAIRKAYAKWAKTWHESEFPDEAVLASPPLTFFSDVRSHVLAAG